MSEDIERIEEPPVRLSDRDILDIHQLQTEPDGVEPPSFHPILQIWQEVLKPAKAEQTKKVTPQWASRICGEYAQLRLRHMNDFRDRYFGKLATLCEILDDEIATDTECLSYTDPKDDVLHNTHHYKNLLLQWQLLFLQWEMEWDTAADDAAIEIAALSEAHKMFFGPTGITAFLDNIGFEYTDDDQLTMQQTLEEFRGERA